MKEKEIQITCPYCGKPAEWVENKAIYGRNYGKSFMMWLCKPCDAYVGCHENTKRPLGTMANSKLREARKKAHSAIDPLWKSYKYNRKEVYAILKKAFGRTIHVGESNEKQCEEIVKITPILFAEKPLINPKLK